MNTSIIVFYNEKRNVFTGFTYTRNIKTIKIMKY